MKYSSLLIFCLFSFSLFGQTFSITNSVKSKTFSLSSYYDIVLEKLDNEKDCCERTEMSGIITQVDKDSIQMSLHKYTHWKFLNNVESENTINLSEAIKFETFAKKDLLNLTHYKSHKAKKRKDAFSITGGMLLFTGLVTGANYFLLKDSNSRNIILSSGGIQLGAGITFLIMARSKTYPFKKDTEVWKFN